MVRLAGLEPATGKTPADFKPAAYANFATAAPNGHAAQKAYHAEIKSDAQNPNANRSNCLARYLAAERIIAV